MIKGRQTTYFLLMVAWALLLVRFVVWMNFSALADVQRYARSVNP